MTGDLLATGMAVAAVSYLHAARAKDQTGPSILVVAVVSVLAGSAAIWYGWAFAYRSGLRGPANL